jgi:hypothetical protein
MTWLEIYPDALSYWQRITEDDSIYTGFKATVTDVIQSLNISIKLLSIKF